MTTCLVRVLDKHIAAVGLLVDQVHNGANNTPPIRQVDIHLARQVSRFEPLRAENGVARIVSRVDS